MGSARQQSEVASGRPWLDRVVLLLGGALLLLAGAWMVHLVKVEKPATVSVAVALPASEPATPDTLPVQRDDAFGVAWPGQALHRIVQMLQWREVASVPLALDDEIVTDQGEYQRVWSSRMIDSSRFAQEHPNPASSPYQSTRFGPAEAVTVDKELASSWRELAATEIALPDNLAVVFRPQGRWLVTVPEGELPQVGDLRVRFEVLDAPAVTAVQAAPDASQARTDEDFVASALDWIARLAAFILALLASGLMLQAISRQTSPQHWLARLSGVAVLALSTWIAVAVLLLAVVLSRLL